MEFIIIVILTFILLAVLNVLVVGISEGNPIAWIFLIIIIFAIIFKVILKILDKKKAIEEAKKKDCQRIIEEKKEQEYKYYQIEVALGRKILDQNDTLPSIIVIQNEYKTKIDKLFIELKEDKRIMGVFENFFPRIPKIIFLNPMYYSYFEKQISKDKFDIGEKILWSSKKDDFLFEKYNFEEIDGFIKDAFEKLIILIKSKVNFESEIDYTFVILRFIQVIASGFHRFALEESTGIEFPEIKDKSLKECLFFYYSNYKNPKSDPWITFFTYKMISFEKFGEINNVDYYNYLERRKQLLELLDVNKEDFDFRLFEIEMEKIIQNVEPCFTLHDVDLMGGTEFEQFVAKLFSKLGYVTKVTKHSGDFGIDVIAEKEGMRLGIQAKCYSGRVTNSAIQEVAAGMNYYKCDKGIVVTNSNFTKAAIDLAKTNKIQLWDRKVLEEKIVELFCIHDDT